MEHNPGADNNTVRAIALFERAVALEPRNAECHFDLGFVLSGVDGEERRAIDHLKRALEIDPTHEEAAQTLAAIEDEQD